MERDPRSHGRWPWCGRRVRVVTTGEEMTLPPETPWACVREDYSRTGTGPLQKVYGVTLEAKWANDGGRYLGNLPPVRANDAWVHLDLPGGSGLYVVLILGKGE